MSYKNKTIKGLALLSLIGASTIGLTLPLISCSSSSEQKEEGVIAVTWKSDTEIRNRLTSLLSGVATAIAANEILAVEENKALNLWIETASSEITKINLSAVGWTATGTVKPDSTVNGVVTKYFTITLTPATNKPDGSTSDANKYTNLVENLAIVQGGN